MRVLTDRDVTRLADMGELVEVCRGALAAAASGDLEAPPRVHADVGAGRLVFTAGGDDASFGFRAYDTMADSRQDQVVPVWNRAPARLAGVVVGSALGALRTGALGGVAVDVLAPPSAARCAVVGTGVQARTQLLGAAAVRDFDDVQVYSRDPQHRQRFATVMSAQVDRPVIAADSVAAATEGADVVLLATSSPTPVVPDDVVAPRRHVSTVGPKRRDRHELAPSAASRADLIATDAPAQLDSAGDDHFLAGTAARDRVRSLGDLVASSEGRPGPEAATLYLSTGLAGSEVLVARHLLEVAG